MKTKPLPSTASPSGGSRCLFSTSDGRQCTMLHHESHPSLCPFHARQERQLLDSAAIAAELASLSGEFTTASDLSHVLGKLFHLLAQDRIPRRKAATLAYIAQLLLHNRHSVQLEIQQTHGFSAWEETLRRALPPISSES
ncbi:MAG: hypothetical protein LAN84_04915 [Acidobacteriia bacterium]|nr:hypothetical protein [Terriglobia bacterium]